MIDVNSMSEKNLRTLMRLREMYQEGFYDLMVDLENETKQRLVSATDMVSIHRLQGRAEAYQDLLRAAMASAKVIKPHESAF